MVTHWQLDSRIDKTVLYLQEYKANEEGLNIVYFDETSRIKVQILFHVRVEFFQYRYIEQSMFSDDDIFKLMSLANCIGPINPFFYQTLIGDVLNSFCLYIDNDNRELIRYDMIDHDTWITVISSVSPKVTITDL